MLRYWQGFTSMTFFPLHKGRTTAWSPVVVDSMSCTLACSSSPQCPDPLLVAKSARTRHPLCSGCWRSDLAPLSPGKTAALEDDDAQLTVDQISSTSKLKPTVLEKLHRQNIFISAFYSILCITINITLFTIARTHFSIPGSLFQKWAKLYYLSLLWHKTHLSNSIRLLNSHFSPRHNHCQNYIRTGQFCYSNTVLKCILNLKNEILIKTTRCGWTLTQVMDLISLPSILNNRVSFFFAKMQPVVGVF